MRTLAGQFTADGSAYAAGTAGDKCHPVVGHSRSCLPFLFLSLQ
jgi:hypothetical protein